jgi:hypothetical protein
LLYYKAIMAVRPFTRRIFVLHTNAIIIECINGQLRGWAEEVDPEVVHSLMLDIDSLTATRLCSLAKHFAVAKFMLNNPQVVENLDMRWLEEAMSQHRIAFIENLFI